MKQVGQKTDSMQRRCQLVDERDLLNVQLDNPERESFRRRASPKSTPSSLLNEKEAADRLQVSHGTLRLWRKKRKIGVEAPVVPFLQVGRSVKYRSEDIESFLQEQINVEG